MQGAESPNLPTSPETPRLAHVAVYVTDLDGARDFYVRYFAAACGSGYRNLTTGFRSYFLSFGDGCRLELMARPGIDAPPDGGRLGWAHIAFSLGSRAAVDALVVRMRSDGVGIVGAPRVTGDGYYEAVVADPEGNLVEVTA